MEMQNMPPTVAEIIHRCAKAKLKTYGEFGPFEPHEWIFDAMQEYATQQTAWKDARIAELEENYRQMTEDRDDYKTKLDVKSTAAENLAKVVEAVKNELDELNRKFDQACVDRDNADGWSTAVQAQRDEAIVLLIESEGVLMALCDLMNSKERATWMGIRQGIERLSSGATKPITPWVLFRAIKPEIGDEVDAFSPRWIDPDYNPTGVRVGFLNDNEMFYSARWNNSRDCYIEDTDHLPEIWRPRPVPPGLGRI